MVEEVVEVTQPDSGRNCLLLLLVILLVYGPRVIGAVMMPLIN